MTEEVKNIWIPVAHFSEIQGFCDGIGLQGRVKKGSPITISKFEKNITVIVVGIGYKNAWLHMNEMLKNPQWPDMILNVGSAGSLDGGLNPGDCFIPNKVFNKVSNRDLKTIQLLQEKYPTKVMNILEATGIKFKSGTLITVKKPVESTKASDEIRASFNASAVDMESFYLADTALQRNIPFVSLKIISDRADGSVQRDFKRSIPQISAKIRDILIKLLKEI